MKGSSKRITSIMASILLFVGSLVVYVYFIQPAYEDIKEKRAEVESRLALIGDYQTSIERIQKLMSDYENVIKLKDTISSVLPVKQDISQSVNQISGLAKINGLRLDGLASQHLAIRPSSQPDLVSGIGTLRLSLRLSGDYGSFRNFLQNLETNLNIMDVTNLKIEPQAAGAFTKSKGASNKFSYTITVDTYYQVD